MAHDQSKHNGKPLTLAALALSKHLPADFLDELGLTDLPGGGVGVPYYDATGAKLAVKHRTALKAGDGSFWPKGKPLAAYGPNRLDAASKAGFLILVEGESDCWALWFHGLPALGLPGANTVKTLLREHVEGVEKVYVHREPDRGGEQFVVGVGAQIAMLGFRGKAFELRMPEGVKDPADLHASDPEKFKERLLEAIQASTPLDVPPARNGKAPTISAQPQSWGAPIPVGNSVAIPLCPVEILPPWWRDWCVAEATATQTPLDLAVMLTLAAAAAAVAGKLRVCVRPGWTEPVNLFTATALLSGERKSAVFSDAMEPVKKFEQEELERMASVIAELTSEHRMLELRLKKAEEKYAKATDPAKADAAKREAQQLARELIAHRVPPSPQFVCDDVTPEKLAKLLAIHGGRMFQAGPEGTAFEIMKGRYSDSPHFDVYLKGHAGDPIRVGRISREDDIIDNPALSVALAVQPDVISGLAEHATMKSRGLLARFFFGIPISRVGSRRVAAPPVPAKVSREFLDGMLTLWRLSPAADENGHVPLIAFTSAADELLRDFEQWIEPQLADGEELSYLAGWANKLAGAIARIAGVLHMAETAAVGQKWETHISTQVVERAIRFGREYLLPHAQAAFGMMGADPRVEKARRVLDWLRSECSEISEALLPTFSRRDVHQAHRRLFSSVDDLDQVLELLEKHSWIRFTGDGRPGRGHRSPTFEVNPAFTKLETAPRTHCTHSTHSEGAGAEANVQEGEL